MKKFLLAASMLLVGIVATFAQDKPDASNWSKGDEITNELNWGNLDFTANPMSDWTLKATKMDSPTTTGGAFEAYDNSNVDLYQYVWLPAGMYRLECQGYYRCGSSGNSTFKTGAESKEGECAWYWLNNKWEDNALLSVYNGVYDEDAEEFIPNHQFKKPLMPRLFEEQEELIHDDLHNGDDGYPGWDRYDYYYPELGVYGPTSFPGSMDWFNAGKYMPNKEGKVKYNSVTFFLTTDGYVKVGVVKKAVRASDTFFVTNFKMFYEGPADEGLDLMAAQEDCADIFEQLEDIIEDNTGLIAAKLYDDYGMLVEEYGDDPESMDMETVTKVMEEAQKLLAGVNQALNDVEALETAIDAVTALVTTTDYPGKEDLETAINEAEALLSDSYNYDGTDDWDAYEKKTAALYEARVAYIMTQAPEKGVYNFSAFINNPFFCDNEYTPVLVCTNPDASEDTPKTYEYKFPDIEGVEADLQPEKTWATIQEKDYKATLEEHSDWVPIANNVKLSHEVYKEAQWVIKSTTWHDGKPAAVTMQHGFPAIGGWKANPDGVPELIYQTVTGLPNGFYSVSGMICNPQAISELQYVFIHAGSGEKESTDHANIPKQTALYPASTTTWGGASPSTWREKTWTILTTGTVYVEDGKLTIGASSDTFYGATGFQLYYYGETPDYNAMLEENLTKAKTGLEDLTFKGDIKKVQDLLNTIPASVEDKETFEAASETLTEALDYISKAKAASGQNWKAPDNFFNLASAHENDDAGEFLLTAWWATGDLEDADDATYLDAIDFDNRYAAYAIYLTYRESLGEFLEDEAVALVVADQNAYLKENVATVEKLDEFKTALGVPYNIAKFKAGGAETATLDNPVDVSFVIINPDFLEGIEKGWTVVKNDGTYTNDNLGIEMLEDGKVYRTIAEIWGSSKDFSISQTLNGLPAGTYELRVHGMYREGWFPDLNNFKKYLDVEEGIADAEKWMDKEATIFAEGKNGQYRQTTPVPSIYSLRTTEPTFTYYAEYGWYTYDEGDKKSYIDKLEYLKEFEDRLPSSDEVSSDAWDGNGKGYDEYGYQVVPFDRNLTVDEFFDENEGDFVSKTFYFPQRTIGVVKAVENDYNNYLAKLYINLPEGGSMTFGAEKGESGGGCSLTLDDFELYYCGTAIPTAIDVITEAGEGVEDAEVEYYSIDGVKLSAPQKGINIIKKGAETKKVFIQ